MGHQITNPTNARPKRPRKARRLTPEGRGRMAAAGAENLRRYRERLAEVKAQADRDLDAKLERFEAELVADLGGSPSAAERALIESAKASYAVVSLALVQLRLAPGRLARARGLSATIAAHQNALLRALKALGLKKRKAEAPTLEQVFADIAKEGKGTDENA